MSVAVVAIEMIVRRGNRLVLQRIRMHGIIERPAIHDVEIRQTVVVVVEPHAARARAFQQRTKLPRPKAVREIDARLLRRIFKPNGRV